MQPATILDILRHRADRQPDQIAYRFLNRRADPDLLTYSELDRKARSVANFLRREAPGRKLAILVYPPGLEFILALLGCMSAGVIPIPVYPLIGSKADRSVERIGHIARDSGAGLILTAGNVRPDLPGVACLATDQIPACDGDGIVKLDPGDLAFLQYTSGSTSAPRGVMITHANLMSNSEAIRLSYGVSPETPVVSWLPPYHDMGLIGGIIQPLFSGAPATLLAPHSFLQSPVLWLEAISRYRGAISPSPNFGYDLCVNKVNPEATAALDLSSWTAAICGAEPVSAATIEAFANKFCQCGFRRTAFRPSYGLAEATLLATASNGVVLQTFDRDSLENCRVEEALPTMPNARVLVGNGSPASGVQIEIVNPESGEPTPDQQTGEIWISGGGVSSGYWHRAESNDSIFRAKIKNRDGQFFLRSGDLGFMHNGHLYIAGRIKDLIILGGKNHYPEDLELAIRASHSAFEGMPGAVFSVDLDSRELLVVVQEIKRQHVRSDTTHNELFRSVHRALATGNVRADAIACVMPATIPRTSSGKVQRHACRDAFLSRNLKVWCEWESARLARS